MSTALERLYIANYHKIADIPPFDEIEDQYLSHLGKPFADGVTWAQFTAQIDRQTQHLTAQVDDRLPIYGNEERKGWRAFSAPDDTRTEITLLCESAPIPEKGPQNGSADALRVLMQMVQHLAKWYPIPKAGIEEKNADFAFYRLRCILAAAGYTGWAPLATEILAQISECPFRPDETYDEWRKNLLEAHRTSGWPSTLLWLDWTAVPESGNQDWIKVIAFAHVLKHMRRANRHAHIVYKGTVEFMLRSGKADNQRALGNPVFWQSYSRVLGKPSSSKASPSDKAAALEWAVASLGFDDLIPAEPIAVLPGSILAGPWSSLLPAVREGTPGFLNPGVRLSGVWRASQGRVTPFDGDEADCLDWAWNTADASRAFDERRRFAKRLPSTYSLVAPSTLLKSYFPNWVLPDPVEQPIDHAAYCCIVDAIICASVLRSDRDDLAREFPLVVILPISPSAEESTNQGKGLLTQAIAGAFVPGIQLLTAPDSGSAPDARAVAGDIENLGTLALDEFQIPSTRSHCLSRDNLQSLCTGGSVTSGKVYENSGKIRLRHSLVINAKWLDMSDDLVNRTVPLFLDALPDGQRNRTDIKEMLENGQISTLIRLAAVATAENAGLAELTHPSARATSGAWRFTAHRLLAAALFKHSQSTGWDEAFAAIDEARSSFGDDLRRHQQMADETGVSATTQSGVNLRLSWAAFWTGADDRMLANLVGYTDREGEARTDGRKWIGVGKLIQFRAEEAGIVGGSFAKLLPVLTGQEARVSNTAVARSLSLAARAFYSASHATKKSVWVALPGDAGNRWEAACVPRSWDGDSPSCRSLCVAVRLKDSK